MSLKCGKCYVAAEILFHVSAPSLAGSFSGRHSVRPSRVMLWEAGGSAPSWAWGGFPTCKSLWPLSSAWWLTITHQCSLSRMRYEYYKDISRVEERRPRRSFLINTFSFPYALLVFLLLMTIFRVLMIAHTKLAYSSTIFFYNVIVLLFCRQLHKLEWPPLIYWSLLWGHLLFLLVHCPVTEGPFSFLWCYFLSIKSQRWYDG